MLKVTDWLIDPQDFHQRSPAEHWRIVEVGDAEQYQRGHIGTAIFLPWQALMHEGPPSPGLLPRTAQLNAILAHVRHNDDVHYWVYDQEGGGWAGRFLWLLEMLGHPRKTYIDGGKLAWQAEGLPFTIGAHDAQQRPPPPTPPVAKIVNPQASITTEELLQPSPGKHAAAIWDARSASEYSGKTRAAARNGHMPGAIHCEWTELMDRQKGYRIRTDAGDYLTSKGLALDAPVVTHCQSHHRSGFTYLVGKTLGMDIRAYAGAWAEWGNRPDTPIICE